MAVKLTGVAPVVRAVIAQLQAGLATQIAAFNAETATTVDLLAPTEIVFGTKRPRGLLGFPIVEVAVQIGTAEAGADLGLGTTGTGFDNDMVLSVAVWHEGAAGELPQTYEMSLGYLRVVQEVLIPFFSTDPDGTGSGAEAGEEGTTPICTWRIDGLPADPTDESAEPARWKVPLLIQFPIRTVEAFTAA